MAAHAEVAHHPCSHICLCQKGIASRALLHLIYFPMYSILQCDFHSPYPCTQPLQRKGCPEAGGGGNCFTKGQRKGFSPAGDFQTTAFSCSCIAAQPLGMCFLLHQNCSFTSSNHRQAQTHPVLAAPTAARCRGGEDAAMLLIPYVLPLAVRDARKQDRTREPEQVSAISVHPLHPLCLSPPWLLPGGVQNFVCSGQIAASLSHLHPRCSCKALSVGCLALFTRI